ncbi:MAG: hypothetical protein ACP5SJ_03625, partial [Candidatus Micrarchaeia archaeon]
MSLPYGSVIDNGSPVPVSNSIYTFLSYNNQTAGFYIYNITIVKAIPKVNLYINGVNFSLLSNETNNVIHPPIIDGKIGITGGKIYPLDIAIYTNSSNKLNLTYSVKYRSTNRIVTKGAFLSNKTQKILSLNIPINQSVSIDLNVSGNANYTGIDPVVVPVNIVEYVPITITNSQSAATSNPFQQAITVNSLAYEQYESGNLQNIEFFYANGTIIPSWLESGNSNTSTST